jgi:hypothetical protein
MDTLKNYIRQVIAEAHGGKGRSCDTIARKITAKIMEKIRNSEGKEYVITDPVGTAARQAQGIVHDMEFGLNVDEIPQECKALLDIRHVYVYVHEMPKLGDEIWMGGSFCWDEYDLVLRIGTADPYNAENRSKIYAKLLPIVRHEIEHAVIEKKEYSVETEESAEKFKEEFRNGWKKYLKTRSRELNVNVKHPKLEDPHDRRVWELRNYWLNPEEIEARVVEFYKEAKLTGRSFGSILQAMVDRLYRENKKKVDANDMMDVVEEFREKVLARARARFDKKNWHHLEADQFKNVLPYNYVERRQADDAKNVQLQYVIDTSV